MRSRLPRHPRLSRGLRLLWASPNSVLGLLLGALLLPLGARGRVVGGVLEIAAFGRAPQHRWPFAAITLGHVIVGTHRAELQRLRAHEQVHVRQSERWGPFFLPAYLLAGGWQWVCGRHPYRDNPFEVQARQIGGV